MSGEMIEETNESLWRDFLHVAVIDFGTDDGKTLGVHDTRNVGLPLKCLFSTSVFLEIELPTFNVSHPFYELAPS